MASRYNRNFIRKQLMREANVYKCICETLRLIYDDVYYWRSKDRKDRVTELLIDAMIMAKKMASRLSYYKEKYKEQSGSSGSSIPMLTDNKQRMLMRKQRWEREWKKQQ